MHTSTLVGPSREGKAIGTPVAALRNSAPPVALPWPPLRRTWGGVPQHDTAHVGHLTQHTSEYVGGCTTLAVPLCPCGPELTGALGLAVGAGAEGQGSPRRGGRGLHRRGRMPLAASQVSPVVCGRLAQARGGAAQGSGSASCLLSSPWWSGSHLPARFGRALEPVEHLMLRRVGTPRHRRGRRERGDEAGRGARSSPHEW